MANDNATAAGGNQTPPQQESPEAGVDIEKLADRVYRLMQAEIRLEQARGVATVFLKGD